MLPMVRLRYDTGKGSLSEGTTHIYPEWGRPAAGSIVTVRVNRKDHSKFKLKRRGWINPGWCERGVCY